jgi:EmrB/QacA subfamily drug resistance transporter
MLVPLNSTMIAVALPSITRQLGASIAQSGWLVSAYLITMASFQPISGKLGDRFGRRPFLLGGVVAFALASVGAATSTSIWILIAFRSGQAISGAVIVPNGLALLREIVPEQRRGSRFGLLGALFSLGAAVGPPVGGVLVGLGGWPAVFWVNVPLCLVVVLLAWRTIPARVSRPPAATFDFAGSVLLAAALSTSAWLLMRMQGLSVMTAIIVGTVAVVTLTLFILRELDYADPVVQPRFFMRRAFATSTAAVASSNLVLYSLLLAVPLLLQRRGGWSVARIGLVLATSSIGLVLLAPVGGRLADRFGRRLPAVVGMSLLASSGCLIALAGPSLSTRTLIVGLAMSGAGLGLGSASLQTVVVEAVSPKHAGMAAAAASTSRYIGSIIGTSVLAGLVSSRGGFHWVLVMIAIAGVASVVLALGLPSRSVGRGRRVWRADAPAASQAH